MVSDQKFRVLFICSGNSCRSPMAEALLRMKLSAQLQERVVVQSAGTLGIEGMPATNYAVRVVEELGGRLGNHRSQGVHAGLMAKADLVLAMAEEHVAFLRRHYPAYRENVYLLKQFAGKEHLDNLEIEDPIGASLPVYRECAQIIADELDRILPALTRLIETRTLPA